MQSDIKVYDANQISRLRFFPFFGRVFLELWVYRFVLYNFVRRSLVSRYRRSVLGIFWSMLNPLISMAVLTVVFSMVFRFPIENYSIYVFSGTVVWGFVSGGITVSTEAIIHADTFLRKIYIPKMIFPLATLLVEFINMLFSFVSMFILMLIVREEISLSLLLLPVAILITFLFTWGIAVIGSVITVYFRDLRYLTQALFSSVLFYAVPIIYDLNIIPEQYHWLFKINPFYYFVELHHMILYRNQMPGWEFWGICFGLSVFSMLIGFTIFAIKENDIIYRL